MSRPKYNQNLTLLQRRMTAELMAFYFWEENLLKES